MKTAGKIVLGIIVIALLIFLYIVRFSDNPIKLRSSDGKVVFGYDQKRRAWLINEFQKYDLGTDGPHLFYQADGSYRLVSSTAGRDTLINATRTADADSPFTCYVEDTSMKPFTFSLKKSLDVSPSIYETQPQKLLAISDIEGNFSAFFRLLRGNGVIDSNYNWTYGDGHLVLIGDFMDRGKDVTACLYLIYKLEGEAATAGGRVHFILGNHEQLNLRGKTSYAKPKYLELVRQMNIPYWELFSKNTELGRWLRTKNYIEQVGDYLFVHGGISKEVFNLHLSLQQMNELCRANIDMEVDKLTDSKTRTLLGKTGILWYRGMVKEHQGEPKLTGQEFKQIADGFSVKAIVVGHTIVDNISTDYNGRLICTDVHHESDDPEGVLITNMEVNATGVNGQLRPLAH